MGKIKSGEINYNDIIQLDGAFSVTHINYGESPTFHGVDSKSIASTSRKESLSSMDKIDDVIGNLHTFNGTEKNCKKNDRIVLWKSFWLEYIDVFDTLSESSPTSVVTIFVGRQAIEIGLKYLLLLKTGNIEKSHDLGVLSDLFFSIYDIHEYYLEWIDPFCKNYCKFIEGDNAEYFRYPEYKRNEYFAGNGLSISWLTYNFAIILLKLLHFAGLDNEIKNENSKM